MIIRRILIFLLISLVIIQFIRPARNLGEASSPSDITKTVHVPDTVLSMLQTSCYDCHSNRTAYPWYTNINPVGLWLHGHVKDGKEGLNFSDLSSFTKKKLDHRLKDIGEMVENGDMPLPSYTWIHTYSILSTAQRKLIKEWTESARKEVGYVE
ncbi:MAG: heme-binding domain-containing protein [Flavitalea sp.]